MSNPTPQFISPPGDPSVVYVALPVPGAKRATGQKFEQGVQVAPAEDYHRVKALPLEVAARACSPVDTSGAPLPQSEADLPLPRPATADEIDAAGLPR